MRTSRRSLTGLVVAFGLITACASGGGTPSGGQPAASPEPGPQGSSIVVRNTEPGAVTINVFMRAEAGLDTPLGSVEAGQTRAFPFDGAPGRYSIRTVGSGGETLSEVFQLVRNSEATWDMSLGRSVRVGGRR